MLWVADVYWGTQQEKNRRKSVWKIDCGLEKIDLVAFTNESEEDVKTLTTKHILNIEVGELKCRGIQSMSSMMRCTNHIKNIAMNIEKRKQQ